MNKIIKLPEDVVKRVRNADNRAAALRDLTENLVEKHANDPDGSFINSPAFQQLLGQYAEAAAVYEEEKSKIEPEYVQQVEGYIAQRWRMNYAACELEVTYAQI